MIFSFLNKITIESDFHGYCKTIKILSKKDMITNEKIQKVMRIQIGNIKIVMVSGEQRKKDQQLLKMLEKI